MKDKLISENTKKYSCLKKEQIIQRITKFKEMRIQIFLMQNQFLLYEVFPLQFKEKKEESNEEEKSKKRLKTAENLENVTEKKKRVNKELNILERYKTHNSILDSNRSKESEIEKTYRRATTKLSIDYLNSMNNHTPHNLKGSGINLLTDKSHSKKFFKDTFNNFIQITDQENEQKSDSKLKQIDKKNQFSFKNCNKETPQIAKLILNTENLNNARDILSTEKSTNVDNKIFDCLTMDNFNRTYNSNFYFSKYSSIKFNPSKSDKKDKYNEDVMKLEQNLLNTSKKFEYLITQDTIKEFDNPSPYIYKTAKPIAKNFLKKNLEKKFLIKSKENYSNVCNRNKSKKIQNIK